MGSWFGEVIGYGIVGMTGSLLANAISLCGEAVVGYSCTCNIHTHVHTHMHMHIVVI